MSDLRLKALQSMSKSAPPIPMGKRNPIEDEVMGDKGMISMAVTPEEKEMILAARAEKEGTEEQPGIEAEEV